MRKKRENRKIIGNGAEEKPSTAFALFQFFDALGNEFEKFDDDAEVGALKDRRFGEIFVERMKVETGKAASGDCYGQTLTFREFSKRRIDDSHQP